MGSQQAELVSESRSYRIGKRLLDSALCGRIKAFRETLFEFTVPVDEPRVNTNAGISRISLRGDAVALVDDDDWFLALEHDWFRDESGYAAMIREGHIERMHRIIVDAQPGELVDHINGDRLDNRRVNLRVCSNRENQRNRPKPKTTAKVVSRFKGVSWDKCNRIWRAKIVVDGRQVHLGTFADEKEAAAAYDQAARIHFGDFARTNSE